MSKKPKTSILSILDEVVGVSDIPINLSPKDAALYSKVTDDHDGEHYHPTKHLPRCEETAKVCYPSRKVATEVSRRIQKKRNVTLRVYFCETCKHHHLTSKKP